MSLEGDMVRRVQCSSTRPHLVGTGSSHACRRLSRRRLGLRLHARRRRGPSFPALAASAVAPGVVSIALRGRLADSLAVSFAR